MKRTHTQNCQEINHKGKKRLAQFEHTLHMEDKNKKK
jgi:hypothetical protein